MQPSTGQVGHVDLSVLGAGAGLGTGAVAGAGTGTGTRDGAGVAPAAICSGCGGGTLLGIGLVDCLGVGDVIAVLPVVGGSAVIA